MPSIQLTCSSIGVSSSWMVGALQRLAGYATKAATKAKKATAIDGHVKPLPEGGAAGVVAPIPGMPGMSAAEPINGLILEMKDYFFFMRVWVTTYNQVRNVRDFNDLKWDHSVLRLWDEDNPSDFVDRFEPRKKVRCL
ncbi:hypothetical protein ACE6H2_002733 [Prunus campanulata]